VCRVALVSLIVLSGFRFLNADVNSHEIGRDLFHLAAETYLSQRMFGVFPLSHDCCLSYPRSDVLYFVRQTGGNLRKFFQLQGDRPLYHSLAMTSVSVS